MMMGTHEQAMSRRQHVVCNILICTYLLQSGWNPLMEASRGGNTRCVQLLLDRGAQLDHQTKVTAT